MTLSWSLAIELLTLSGIRYDFSMRETYGYDDGSSLCMAW